MEKFKREFYEVQYSSDGKNWYIAFDDVKMTKRFKTPEEARTFAAKYEKESGKRYHNVGGLVLDMGAAPKVKCRVLKVIKEEV